jgi:methionyl-tRNA formyltransferase
MTMKALLVTSRVTFVPENYDALVCGMAEHPLIGGLLELDNAELSLVLKGLGLAALGARKIGLHLLRNQLGSSCTRRQLAYESRGKGYYRLSSMNSPEAIDLVRQGGYDLIVNARTRCIYKDEILQTPPLGCINVHHGLLPEQRGTMCDLWSLYEGGRAGFSIHRMSRKIDDGDILRVVPVTEGGERDYAAYLARSAEREREELSRLLDELARTRNFSGTPNRAPAELKHRRNPTRAQVGAMRRKGMVL